MCGICGFINNGYSETDLRKMNNTISHRGPDDEGYYIDKKIAMAHKRLSIIDLSPQGRQPMNDLDNKITVVFNGEIYNYKEIKLELINIGYEFRTNTDTEVILYSYIEWGIKCIEKFNGMFAIAIWEHDTETLTLIRDRVGIKPIYYYHKNDEFAFASELKPIINHPRFEKEINYNSLNLYLSFGYIPAPYSIYENTYKLKPGHYLILKNNKVEINTYWDIVDIKDFNSKKNDKKTENEYIDTLEELLKSAIEYRMVSDVPIGAFLSGGIDSSLVVSIMQNLSKDKIRTFSIGFKNSKFDESKYAKEIADYLGTIHTELYIDEDEMLNLVKDLTYYYDEPMYDSSAIPTMLVSKLAKQDVTVVLTGDGGDEQFYGYRTYDYLNKLEKVDRLPNCIRKMIGKIGGIYNSNISKVLNYDNGVENLGLNIRRVFSIEEVNKLLSKNVEIQEFKDSADIHSSLKNTEYIEREMLYDIKSYMVDDVLTKVDRATMKYALEARCPLLDYRMLEFSTKVPLKLKKNRNTSKYILKQLLYKYLPQKYTDRPKKGFSVPISEWINGELKADIDKYFDKEYLLNQNIFNSDNLIDMKSKKILSDKQIWNIYIFQKWYDMYM